MAVYQSKGIWGAFSRFFSAFFSPFTWVYRKLFVRQALVTPTVISTPVPILQAPISPFRAIPVQKPRVVVAPDMPVIQGSPILFYERNQPYYHFTNFASSSILDEDNLSYPTAEHYFQAQKFSDPHIAQRVRKAPSAREVFNLANGKNGQYRNEIKKNWHAISSLVMLEAQLYKYAQNPELLKELLATGDRLLIEDAGPRDSIWGNGQKGSTTDEAGENRLGKILMATRSAFRKALQENNPVQNVVVTFKGGHTLTHPEVDLTEFGLRLDRHKRATP